MANEFPRYGTPESTGVMSDMAGEAVRSYYAWLNIGEILAERGEAELADLSDAAAEACRGTANQLLHMLNPDSDENNVQRQV